jgi:hypothetical protein
MLVSKSDFLGRFTLAELATILAAADSNPVLRAYMYKLEQRTEDVDLSSETVSSGILMIEQAGLIAPGRAAEILATKTARVLAPFDAVYPGVYNITKINNGVYSLEDAGDFDSQYVEVL